MHFRLVSKEPETYVIVFETGDEVASGIKQVAEQTGVCSGSLQAIGAMSSVKLAWLNGDTLKYQPSVVLHEQVELLSLVGDITQNAAGPFLHAHAVVGKADGTAHGGHLLEAYVRPTCEVILTASPAHLRRVVDPATGLALIQL